MHFIPAYLGYLSNDFHCAMDAVLVRIGLMPLEAFERRWL